MADAANTDLLSKTGLVTGAMGIAFASGSAAQAKTDGAKSQADALRAAAASRQSQQQPAAMAPDAQYDHAKALLAGGDVAGAMAGFRRVLAAQPQSVDAMNGLAITYDRMGRHDVARGWYEAALAVQPDAAAVLANLGYSLTLQDQDRAAIPFLQAAAATQDMRAAATARRLLAQISARLTAEAAAAPLQPRPAEIALVTSPLQPTPLQTADIQPRPAQAVPLAVATVRPATTDSAPAAARIELAANGEARLVLGAAAPAPVLVQALGDSAALVLVADRWTAQDDARLQHEARALQQAEAAVVRRREQAPPMLALAVPMARLVMVDAPALRLDRPLVADMVLAVAPVADRPRRPKPARAVSLASAISTPAPRTILAAPILTTAPVRHQPVLRAAPLLAAAPHVLASSTGWRIADDTDATPAWLITARRAAPQGSPGPMAPSLLMATYSSLPAFESDDDMLNLFAARHRAAPDDDSPGARQAAIARLEALIARVRRA